MSGTAYIFLGTPLKPTRINQRTQRLFVKALNNVLDQDYAKLVVSITSEGGFCEDGFIMYHALRQVAEAIEVQTHAVMDCTSMAAVLHLAGDNRTFAPATVFGLHAASNEDGIDPTYNTRIGEIYKDRANWSSHMCKKHFSSTTLVMPTTKELVDLKVFTQVNPIHVPFSLVTHTIN